ncbi:hypothetical protein PT158_08235 [Erysipelothrix rhusiopathiae]|nr:hypothetical protein [Erysipelothrix rhusiopathiae]MDE8323504.1 hypothetical protein [Erysipelothrix rhusiopathiae]
MEKQINTKKSTVIILILLFLCIAAPIASCSVYGSFEFWKAIRSNFMKNVLIPLTVSIITFGGVAYSVKKTINYNQKQLDNTLKQNHEHKLLEIEQQKAADKLQRDLLAREIIANSRQKWISDIRDTYSDFIFSLYSQLNSKSENQSVETISKVSDSKVKLNLMLNPYDRFDLFICYITEEIIGALNKIGTNSIYINLVQDYRIVLDFSLSAYLKLEWTKIEQELFGNEKEFITKYRDDKLEILREELLDLAKIRFEIESNNVDKNDFETKRSQLIDRIKKI